MIPVGLRIGSNLGICRSALRQEIAWDGFNVASLSPTATLLLHVITSARDDSLLKFLKCYYSWGYIQLSAGWLSQSQCGFRIWCARLPYRRASLSMTEWRTSLFETRSFSWSTSWLSRTFPSTKLSPWYPQGRSTNYYRLDQKRKFGILLLLALRTCWSW